MSQTYRIGSLNFTGSQAILSASLILAPLLTADEEGQYDASPITFRGRTSLGLEQDAYIRLDSRGTDEFGGRLTIQSGKTGIGEMTIRANSVVTPSSLQTLSFLGYNLGVNSATNGFAFTNGQNQTSGYLLNVVKVTSSSLAIHANSLNTTVGKTLAGPTDNGYTLQVLNTGISGSMNVDGKLLVSGSLVQISGSLDVSGSGRFTDGLTVTGSLNVTGSTTQTGNNTLIGNTTLSGSIAVSGSSDFNNSRFVVTGSSYFKGYHEVSGSTNVTGSLSVIGDLNVVSGSSFLRWGNKLFNYGSFYHTASINPTQNVSGSFPYSTTAESEGISIVNGSRITFGNTGKYNIQFSAQLNTPTAADVHIWIKKDGTNVADTAGRLTTSNNDHAVPSWNYVLSISSGSYLELEYQTTAANTTFPYIAATGNIPGIPSIIVTVTQVA